MDQGVGILTFYGIFSFIPRLKYILVLLIRSSRCNKKEKTSIRYQRLKRILLLESNKVTRKMVNVVTPKNKNGTTLVNSTYKVEIGSTQTLFRDRLTPLEG